MTTARLNANRATAGARSLPAFRLRGKTYKAALTLHILTSVGWFGVAVAVAFCGLAAASTSDPTVSRALYRFMELAPWLSIPAGVAAFASGVLVSLGTVWGLFKHWWVVAKIALAIAVIVTDAFVVRAVAHDALVTGAPEAPLYGSTIAHVAVLAIATVLSVFKPKARTPWSPAPQRTARPRGRTTTQRSQP